MLYNHDSKDSVQDVVLECFCPLVENIVDEYYILREDENLALFLPAYMGKELVEMLLEDDLDLWVHEESEMNLLNEDTDVLISIFDDGMLFVEEAKGLNGKFKRSPDSVLVYFYDGYPHKSLRDFDEDTNILCFGFVDEFEDEYDEEGILDLITDENDDVVGFRAYRETDSGFFGYEYLNTDGMDEDDIIGVLRKIGMM
jgi:hypothetical protein